MRNAAAIPATGLLAGCAAALFFACPILPFLIASAACVAAVWLAYRYRAPRAVAVCAALAFFFGGAALAADAWRSAGQSRLRAAFERAAIESSLYATIDGTLKSDASPGDPGVSISIDASSITVAGTTEPVDGGVVASVGGTLAAERLGEWIAGRRIRAPVALRRPAIYLDPGVADRERTLARQGIALVGSVKSGALVEVVARGSPWAEIAGVVRAHARRAISAAVGRWSARSAAIVTAIVIGDRAGLGADVQRSLQEAGTYHVIAISGGNIAILAGVFLAAFRFAGLLGRTAMVVAAVALVAYGYLVGGGASVDRATLMAVVYFGTRAWDHRSAATNTLALVAATLVAADPLAIADPAFLLTFGATLGILLVMPPLAAWRLPRAAGAAASLFAASIAAEVMLLPVAASFFSRVTVAGLALNFLAIPLMAVAQLAGMALVPIALVSWRAALAIGWIAHVGAAGLVWSAGFVHVAPALTWRVPPPSWPAILVYYVALVFAWRLRGRARVTALVCTAMAAIWIATAPSALLRARGDGRLHVTFVDVGQGDATLIRFPGGTTWAVDAGGLLSSGGFDIGDRIVAPVLRDAGVRRLDRLVLTHGDPDHVGGAAALIREFRPREVWEGVPVPRDALVAVIQQAAHDAGSIWRQVRSGDAFDVDGARVTICHPPPPDWERQKVRNDDSIVLDVRFGDVSVVLPGDVGRSLEPGIAARIPASPIRVLKAGHHGSNTSSGEAFVGALRPDVAVISVGRWNRFGHPAPEVVERFEAQGAQIFRTDRDGAIFLESAGDSVSIRTFLGKSIGVSKHESTKDTKPRNEH